MGPEKRMEGILKKGKKKNSLCDGHGEEEECVAVLSR